MLVFLIRSSEGFHNNFDMIDPPNSFYDFYLNGWVTIYNFSLILSFFNAICIQ